MSLQKNIETKLQNKKSDGFDKAVYDHSHDNIHDHGHDHSHEDHHEHTIIEELYHHLPYAIFSVALGMIILSLLDYSNAGSNALVASDMKCSGFHMLFHSFHFLHILFAATGTIITFSRFSRNIFYAILVGTISPAIFCMLSDVVFPYFAGRMLGVPMTFHICFHRELHNILPFLFMGILNGIVLRRHGSKMLGIFSVGSHFVHILISSLASLFYMVAHGFSNWYPQMGLVFLFLVIAIVIPCTFSDVIVPMYFARIKNK